MFKRSRTNKSNLSVINHKHNPVHKQADSLLQTFDDQSGELTSECREVFYKVVEGMKRSRYNNTPFLAVVCHVPEEVLQFVRYWRRTHGVAEIAEVKYFNNMSRDVEISTLAKLRAMNPTPTILIIPPQPPKPIPIIR